MTVEDLRALRDKPFELLQELEKRARAAIASRSQESTGGRDWTGVAFRLGSEHFLADREEIREVLPIPDHLTRVPGAKSWVKGLANVRGQLLAILDLRAFLGAGAVTDLRLGRVLAVSHKDMPVGLLVDEVFGFRRFSKDEFTEEFSPTIIRCESYLVGAYHRGQETWSVFSLGNLVQSPGFFRVAA